MSSLRRDPIEIPGTSSIENLRYGEIKFDDNKAASNGSLEEGRPKRAGFRASLHSGARCRMGLLNARERL
jgi:hypothetical protein